MEHRSFASAPARPSIWRSGPPKNGDDVRCMRVCVVRTVEIMFSCGSESTGQEHEDSDEPPIREPKLGIHHRRFRT